MVICSASLRTQTEYTLAKMYGEIWLIKCLSLIYRL